MQPDFTGTLKELRNCILCIIRVQSLFCSVGVYISLHFLPILLVKLAFNLSVFLFIVFLYLQFLAFSFSVLCFGFNVISTLHEKYPIRSYLWSVFSCIRTEYRKIQTRNNSVFGHFSRSAKAWEYNQFFINWISRKKYISCRNKKSEIPNMSQRIQILFYKASTY